MEFEVLFFQKSLLSLSKMFIAHWTFTLGFLLFQMVRNKEMFQREIERGYVSYLLQSNSSYLFYNTYSLCPKKNAIMGYMLVKAVHV
jgi:hypothetical protein